MLPQNEPILYQLEPNLTPAEFIDLLVRSTLAERRPVDRPEVIAEMLRNADIVLCARHGEKLVAVMQATMIRSLKS